MNRNLTGELLVALDRDVEAKRITLNQIPATARLVGRYKSGAAATEAVEYNAVAPRAITNCIRYQRHRLWMQRTIIAIVVVKRIDSGIIPDVSPVTAEAVGKYYRYASHSRV